ncbi:MAG: helix-turn-helix domain-containing protein [Polyangiaceae bacterium]|nr:helix-turn-helix domain-containing protein [Polyangiaceae bacterium]
MLEWARRCGDPVAARRAQILAYVAHPQATARGVADTVGCSRSHVYRVAQRFGKATREGLRDGCRSSGRRIADGRMDALVDELVAPSPLDFGYPRPTWTRALLLPVVQEKTGTRFSLTTRTRVLQRIGARRGWPRLRHRPGRRVFGCRRRTPFAAAGAPAMAASRPPSGHRGTPSGQRNPCPRDPLSPMMER